MQEVRTETYENVAHIYEHLMRYVKYDKWAEYIHSLSKDYTTSKSRVLELACGNGNLSAYLKKYYSNIVISDKSLTMLNENDNSSLRKVCCDMLSLSFKTKFDLIFSTFDSINYLKTQKALLTLFNEINNILDAEGIFTFDASLERNSKKHVEIPVRRGTYEGIKYVQRTEYNTKNRIHKNIFRMRLKDGKIYKEVHEQKIYPFETYFKLLEKSKMRVVECYDAFTFDNANSNMERVQFLVRKY